MQFICKASNMTRRDYKKFFLKKFIGVAFSFSATLWEQPTVKMNSLKTVTRFPLDCKFSMLLCFCIAKIIKLTNKLIFAIFKIVLFLPKVATLYLKIKNGWHFSVEINLDLFITAILLVLEYVKPGSYFLRMRKRSDYGVNLTSQLRFRCEYLQESSTGQLPRIFVANLWRQHSLLIRIRRKYEPGFAIL